MSSDKPFVPQFGPNGAVMNAPGMSDAKRKELEMAATAPSGAWRNFSGNFGSIATTVLLAAYVAGYGMPLFARMEVREDFAAKMNASYLGVPAWAGIGLLFLLLAVVTLLAWEIFGVRAADRKIPAPFAARLGLALVSVLLQLGLFAGLIMVVGGKQTYLAGAVLAVVSWLGHFGLNRFARARGWVAPSSDDKPASVS